MVNYINYRFFSCKDFTRLPISTTSIPLWELRSTIISIHCMNSEDFDLIFFDDHITLTDDHHTLSNHCNVIIKRIPAWMSSKKKDTKSLRTPSKFLSVPTSNYICYRCGEKGHFIQNCPTNADKNYDYIRVRKPTGIPKSFLKPVNEEEMGTIITEQGKMKVTLRLEEWEKLKGDHFDVPIEFKCQMCEMLMASAVLSNCNHGFCENCVGKGTKCNVCGSKINNIIDDILMRKKIEKFIEKANK